MPGPTTIGYFDGLQFFHAGCIELSEDDVELVAVFEGDPIPAPCDVCGQLLPAPSETRKEGDHE